MSLKEIAYTYPSIDNHTHPLLKDEHRSAYPLEAVVTEADGDALEDTIHTVAFYRATRQLAELFDLPKDATWEDVKSKRNSMPYDQLIKLCFEKAYIQCLLLDDGLGTNATEREMCYKVSWHDHITKSPSKRIVRIEVVAQDILKSLFDENRNFGPETNVSGSELLGTLFTTFSTRFTKSITDSALDPLVVGFKSVACYRTGLNIATSSPVAPLIESLGNIFVKYATEGEDKLRLQDKTFNDFVVRTCLRIAGKHKLPVQFHTGLGDSDITVTLCSPAHMQPIVKTFPDTTFIILHSSYPYTRDAGLMASLYKNVYLDFGEVFQCVSAQGLKNIVRQILEICPTTKMLWSTDAHFWPESYYLGAIQSRKILYEVLSETVESGDITETQACDILKRALFENSNRAYNLGLEPIK